MLTEKLMHLTIAGGSEWVMVLLLVLSVISIAVVVERLLFFRRQGRKLDRLDRLLTPQINAEDPAQIQATLEGEREPTLTAAASGLNREHRDREAAEKVVESSLVRHRLEAGRP